MAPQRPAIEVDICLVRSSSGVVDASFEIRNIGVQPIVLWEYGAVLDTGQTLLLEGPAIRDSLAPGARHVWAMPLAELNVQIGPARITALMVNATPFAEDLICPVRPDWERDEPIRL